MVTFDSLFQNELQKSVNASMQMEYILSFRPNGILYVAWANKFGNISRDRRN